MQFDKNFGQAEPLLEQKHTGGVLSLLSDYHFSDKTLPSLSACLKKYAWMLLSAGGGLGYWSATKKYNENHDCTDFIAYSNTVCVIVVTSFFLLQSVDLARNYLNKLAGSAPPELSEIIETVSPQLRRSIKLKTGLGSSISGLPFLIIALNDSLPWIEIISSGTIKETGEAIWAFYFYAVNVGLHILPFALLQTLQFDYYLWPLTVCVQGFKKLFKKEDEAMIMLDCEITQIGKELQDNYDEIRGIISDRISRSLIHFFEKTSVKASLFCGDDMTEIKDVFSDRTEGLERLFFLLQNYPPKPAQPLPSRNFQRFLRIFGAQLELGGAFIWWTNIFPTLYTLFKKTGMNVALVYSLTVILGATPSYVLFVLLAFFGENQFPRLIHYLINCGSKILGLPNTSPLFPPIAKARPILFGIGVLAIGYMSWFAPVNAKSLNEEQYQDIFSSDEMTVLNIYADTGILIMSFISLLDFFTRYLTEASAVFGTVGSTPQLLTRLLITHDNLAMDIMRTKPQLLVKELKELKDEKLKLLVGSDKDSHWLSQQEEKIISLETQLEQQKLAKVSSRILLMSEHNIQSVRIPEKSSPGFFNRCYAALFSNCLGRCRKKTERTSTPQIYSQSA
jgi:hypothetical protein